MTKKSKSSETDDTERLNKIIEQEDEIVDQIINTTENIKFELNHVTSILYRYVGLLDSKKSFLTYILYIERDLMELKDLLITYTENSEKIIV